MVASFLLGRGRQTEVAVAPSEPVAKTAGEGQQAKAEGGTPAAEQPKSESQPKAEKKPEPPPKDEPKPQPAAKAEPKPEPKEELNPTPKAEPKPEPKPEPSVESKPAPAPTPPAAAADPAEQPKSFTAAAPAVLKELEKVCSYEPQYMVALGPAEAQITLWDFAGAGKELEKLHFDEPELARRLTTRRDEVQRMAAMKARMIEKINAADPHLSKAALMLRGMAGEVTGADDKAIHAETSGGTAETHPWHQLSDKARGKVLQLVVDQEKADDWLAAGLLTFVGRDVAGAEKFYRRARGLGAAVEPQLGRLAAASLLEVKDLLENKQYDEAVDALKPLEEKYGSIPWFTENKAAIDDARRLALWGIRDKEAEKLWNDATDLLGRKELPDLKSTLDQLKAKYGDCTPMTDPERKAQLAEMERALGSIGKLITVSQDGKSDFQKIQEAINASSANGLIVIQDNGPYKEQLSIPAEKARLTIHGKRGCWPVVTSQGMKVETLVGVLAPEITLERLILVHTGTSGDAPVCVQSSQGQSAQVQIRLRLVTAYVPKGGIVLAKRSVGPVEASDSILIGDSWSGPSDASVEIANCVFVGDPRIAYFCNLRRGVVTGSLTLSRYEGATAVDFIVTSIGYQPRLEYCNIQSRASSCPPRIA